jgi:FkbM family methyltransferase
MIPSEDLELVCTCCGGLVMFVKSNFFKRKTRGVALRCFHFPENNGVADWEINGESAFIDSFYARFSSQKTEVVVFDIGANVGNYANKLLEKSHEHKVETILHVFEPTEKCGEILRKMFVGKSEVRVNVFGASDSERNADIFYEKEGSSFASLYQRDLAAYDVKLDISEKIFLRRMDSYIEEAGVGHIDLVKIDVEGHEMSAFNGFGNYLRNDFIDFVQFEYGGANLDSRTSLSDIYRLFESRGYKIAKIMKNGLEIRSYQPYMENFFYSNYVAVSEKMLQK